MVYPPCGCMTDTDYLALTLSGSIVFNIYGTENGLPDFGAGSHNMHCWGANKGFVNQISSLGKRLSMTGLKDFLTTNQIIKRRGPKS